MKPVDASEIKSLDDYELARPAFRERVLAIKNKRRVRVGEHLTVLFENHDTVLYQIQEMLRIERISDPRAIAHEVATYNELIGRPDELGATLLIEYEDPVERDRRLRELVGLESHLHMRVEGAGQCTAVFDDRQLSTERISSVHYLRFPLGAELAQAVRRGGLPEIFVDHPSLSVRAELSREQAAALAEDLSG